MTPEQKLALEGRREKLVDLLIEEADPGKFPTMETKEGRGDRAWHKANAIKTATLIMRIEDLMGLRGIGTGTALPKETEEETETDGASAGPSDIDKLIASADGKVSRIRRAKSGKQKS